MSSRKIRRPRLVERQRGRHTRDVPADPLVGLRTCSGAQQINEFHVTWTRFLTSFAKLCIIGRTDLAFFELDPVHAQNSGALH